MKKDVIERELDTAFYPALVIGAAGVVVFYISQMLRALWLTDPLLSRLYTLHGVVVIPATLTVLAIVLTRPRNSGHLHAYAFVIAGLLVAASLHTVIATAEPFNAIGLLVVGVATGCVMLRTGWFAASFGLIVASYVYVDWYYPNSQSNMLTQTTAAYATIVLTGAIFISRRYARIQGIKAQNAARKATEVLEQELAARRTAEASMREAQQRLAIVMDQVPIGIFWKDHEHRYLGCNQKFAEFYGHDNVRGIIAQTDHELYTNPGIADCIEEIENHIMQTGESTENAIARYQRSHGQLTFLDDDEVSDATTFITRTRRMPLYDEEGNSIGILGTVEDITEEVRRGEEESQLEQKLMNSQKFESLGALSGGIAHEFNNILVGVLGNADYMKLKLEPDSKLHKNLDGVIESAQRASRLIQQMLLYSGRREIKKGRTNLNQLILDLDGIIRASISKRVSIQYDLDPNLPSLTADGGQLRQMVVNLIMNASESVDVNDGTIIVRTGVGTVVADDALDTSEPQPSIFVEIEDDGCGMDEETLRRIFDPFFTTKFMGRGLGMSAVRGIVHAHGGAIAIRSELDKGTTVRVDLLRDQNAPEIQVAVATPMTESVVDAEGTVLLIDDEEMVVKVARYMLEDMGYRVVSALNGDEGLRLFDELRDEIRVVLVDRTMPKMSGEQVVAAIRGRNSDIPAILCSGYSDDDLPDAILNDRMTTTLHKPFKQADLEAGIRALTVLQ